jgi:hypothetical protein
MSAKDWPKFEDLPLDKNGPPGNAWGLFGENDQLGRLNLITPLTVKEAASEIQQGIRVSLDWPINKPVFPAFKRPKFQHQLISYAPRTINDEVLTFNTQCSTQWDGFRHYGSSRQPLASSQVANFQNQTGYQESKQFYNGNVQDDIAEKDVLGIDGRFLCGPPEQRCCTNSVI